MSSSKAKSKQGQGRIWRSDALMGLLVLLAAPRFMSPEQLASVRVLRPELPQELADILDKILSKSPAQRSQTGAELAADLHRAIAVLPASTDAGRAPDNKSAATLQRDENAMLATVVTPAPVSSTVPERAGADIRL